MPEITIQQSSLDLAANVTAAILVCKNKSISLHFLNHSFTQILRRERTDRRICIVLRTNMTTFTLLQTKDIGSLTVLRRYEKERSLWGVRCHDSFSTLLFFFYLLSFNLSLLFFIATFGTLTAGLSLIKTSSSRSKRRDL